MGGREVRTRRDGHFEGATEFCDVMPSGGSDREVGRRDKVFSLHKGNPYNQIGRLPLNGQETPVSSCLA